MCLRIKYPIDNLGLKLIFKFSEGYCYRCFFILVYMNQTTSISTNLIYRN